MATLTMIGMYKWNPELFSYFAIPSGLDRDAAINCVLTRAGGFEVLYPDFDFMQEMIGLISKKWARTFQKWYDALQLEYNPIENYDRHEEWSDTGTVVHKTGETEAVKGTSSDNSSSDGNTNTSVSTYDSDSMHPDSSSTSHQSASSGGSTTSDTTRSGSDNEASSSNHTGHTHGNIGVTTSQQMLEAELDLQEWNLYEHIADIFVRELCIPVY